MAEQADRKPKPPLGKWKKIGEQVFEVTALSRQRAIEVGAALLRVPPDEILIKPVGERSYPLTSQRLETKPAVRRYRVSLRTIDGVFLLAIDGSAVFLQVDAPRHGGRSVIFDAVLQELEPWPLSAVDTGAINRAVERADWLRVLVARLAFPDDAPRDGVVVLTSTDQMRAYAIARGTAVRSRLDREAFEAALARTGVVAGILEDEIAHFLASKSRERPVLVAQGEEPVEGTPTRLECLVPMVPGLDGDPVPVVEPGRRVVRVHPGISGRPGLTVTGQTLPIAYAVQRRALEFAGPGVAVSGDGNFLVAAIPGHALLLGEQASVFPIEELDCVAGNHESAGSLIVRGPVNPGCQLRVAGHVEVGDALQNAVIRAAGSIVVHGGATGKSLLAAGQDVLADFVRGSVVKAGGSVRLGSEAVQGTVWAEDQVVITSGRIDGGLVRAGRQIAAGTLGNPRGRTTRVIVGGVVSDSPPRILAWQQVLPGTIVRIGQSEIEIDQPLGPTVFELDQNRIVVRPISPQDLAGD